METVLVDLEAIARTTGGVLRRAHLDALGLTPFDIRELLASRALARVHRDLYRLPTPDDAPDAAFRAAVRGVHLRHDRRVITGSAALALHGLPLVGGERLVDVAFDHTGGSSARSIVRTVAMPPQEQIQALSTGRVARPARAALDAARLHSLVAGVVGADAALRDGWANPGELAAVVATMEGLHGVSRSRLAVALASAESESPGESWSAVVMHQHGIPAPRRQQVFTDRRGVIGRVDFWWPEHGVIGEFDGRVKYGRELAGGVPHEVLWGEKRREDRLRGLDLAVVRWTWPDLHDPWEWLSRLRAALGVPRR